MSQRAKHHHESIELSEQQGRRLKVIRQDRMSLEDMNAFVEINNKKYKVLNISAFGILLETSESQLPNEIECPFVIENVELGILKLRYARAQKVDIVEKSLVGFEIIGEPFDISRITAVEEAKKVIDASNIYQSATKRIPDLFARKVYEVKDWLEDLQREINATESKMHKTDSNNHAEFEQAFVQIIGDYFNRIMPSKNKDLGELLKDYNATVIKDCYEFFREKLKLLIYQAPFSDRVFHKPLGYAGDFEMMNIIYRTAPEGESLFAKCLHDYWVKQPAAQAVRNRANYIQTKITQFLKNSRADERRFLSVACGPAKEWQDLISKKSVESYNIKVDLLDQDEHALKFAQRQMRELGNKHNSKIEFGYINKAIKNIIGRGLDEKYDMIYSAGLFDYFSDPVAQVAANKLYDALKPGGQLIIGNFNVENPNSIMMDLALDWHLIYRSIEDLKRLYERTGDAFEVESEDLSINLFCIITKKQWN